jgi:uncharacterized membrane protein
MKTLTSFSHQQHKQRFVSSLLERFLLLMNYEVALIKVQYNIVLSTLFIVSRH